GVVCLPNEEIFAGLAQMGYEKPSTKLAFYKAFFSIQWKFLIHTILQSLSAKRTSWNEFSTAMDSAVVAASIPIPAARPKILNIAAALAVSTKRRKGVVIRDPEEELPSDTPAETPKNTEGYKMDFFKGMKYDEILPIFQAKFDANIRFLFKSREEIKAEDQEIIKSINETHAQKAAKRRKLSEEAQEDEDLRKQLEVVEDEDDDVFVEATPLAQKTLFEKPDGQHAIWRNQKSVHGLALVKRWKLLTSCSVYVITLSTVQLFLLVERRYPLLRFTLEQLVNVAKLQVEEESEISLELLSESKDCQSNIDAARLKLKLFKNITAAEDITK
nr:hypothetical protein [Tanacetum cinerariifolium]